MDKETIFWEALQPLLDHKKEFDEEVFQAILKAMETYKDLSIKEFLESTKTVEIWKLKEVEDTLRMVSNTLKSPARVSCLDRCIMRSWNEIFDILHRQKPTAEERLNYYTQAGQTPCIRKR